MRWIFWSFMLIIFTLKTSNTNNNNNSNYTNAHELAFSRDLSTPIPCYLNTVHIVYVDLLSSRIETYFCHQRLQNRYANHTDSYFNGSKNWLSFATDWHNHVMGSLTAFCKQKTFVKKNLTDVSGSVWSEPLNKNSRN